MTFIMTIWTLSLLVMLALVIFRSRKETFSVSHYGDAPENLGEFVRDTISMSASRFTHHANKLKPHADRVAGVFISVSKKGHDTFIDRVFGKMDAERGTASSFFLKNIAEHKAESKKDSDAKNGY